jgi:hypothetical protein
MINGWDDQTNRTAAPPMHRLGRTIADIAQGLHGFFNLFASRKIHQIRMVKAARNRRN